MQGINLIEEGHPAVLLPPVDITGGAVCPRFSMERYRKAAILVTVGVSAAAFTKILVKECDAASGGTANAIPFSVYKAETATIDIFGPREAVTAAGLTPAAANNITYLVDLDARELSEGFHFVELELTNDSGNAVQACVLAVLTGGRYIDENETVLA